MSKVAYGVYTYTINVSPSSKVGVAEFASVSAEARLAKERLLKLFAEQEK